MSINDSLLIVGCGHSEALDNFNNNALIQNSQGNMLIDCGHTIKHALHAQSLSIKDIDSIFITHVHGDHVFGLERVAYESIFKYKKKIRLIFHESIYDELWTNTLMGSLGKIGEGNRSLDDYFELVILKSFYFQELGIDFELIPVEHTPNKATFGLYVKDRFFYSSDTKAIPETIKKLNFDVCFHDATLQDWNPVHATLSSLIESYPLNLRKKIFLMSYEDNWSSFDKIVAKEFKGFAHQSQRVNF
jgi:ribonuclease BN (tRNA processing enzyme)